MGAHGPAHLIVHIGLDHLGAPVAVVTPDETRDRDVVQEAGHKTSRRGGLPGVRCAL